METQKAIIEHPLTVEQNIRAYKAFKERKKVRLRVEGKLVKSISVITRTQSTSRIPTPLASNYTTEQSSPLTNQSPIPEWQFANDRVWHLGALVGENVVNDAVATNGGRLTSKLIIDLLTRHPLPFYIDANESILFLGNNKLAELELGPLKPISSVEAVQRYGLAKLEEASEKSYTRV